MDVRQVVLDYAIVDVILIVQDVLVAVLVVVRVLVQAAVQVVVRVVQALVQVVAEVVRALVAIKEPGQTLNVIHGDNYERIIFCKFLR